MVKLYAVLVACVLLAGLVLAAVLMGSDGSSEHEVAPAQSRAFSVFRAPAQAPPPELTARMEEAVSSRDFGLDYSLAQKVSTRIGEDAWVIPGRGFVCVMGSDPVVAGCNTTKQTIANGMSVVAILPAFTSSGKRYDLYGVAPDGVEEVVVETDAGRRARVPVFDNVYAFRANTNIRAKIVR